MYQQGYNGIGLVVAFLYSFLTNMRKNGIIEVCGRSEGANFCTQERV